ncbi:hypothetical protein ACQKE8_17750 [Sphingobium limneticum]|uniref:hypothetical protein n=1 Tax=Sphingobium limneticum TaxID=1007511 RepID=UPI003D07C464
MLICGYGVRDQKLVTLSAPGAERTKLPLRFVADEESADASLEVTGTVAGGSALARCR